MWGGGPMVCGILPSQMQHVLPTAEPWAYRTTSCPSYQTERSRVRCETNGCRGSYPGMPRAARSSFDSLVQSTGGFPISTWTVASGEHLATIRLFRQLYYFVIYTI